MTAAADGDGAVQFTGSATTSIGGEEEQSYEQAAGRVEEIITRLDSGEASLTETLGLLSEGRDLIEICARRLEEVGQGLQELRLDELVARLEAGTQSP